MAPAQPGNLPTLQETLVDVRIGVTYTPKEIDVELEEGADAAKVKAEVESALGGGTGVLWLTDRKGRQVGVPVDKVAYVEIGSPSDERRVGFGA
jgi:hypothetical protein